MRPRVTAVDALEMEVRQGEVYGLLGPNGSGKSTTIKMILSLLFPTKGRIAVFGKSPREMEVKARTGYLPEESYLYRFLNARETLEYYGRLFGLSRLDRRKRIDMLLEMVGLESVQRRPVGEYSKGMQRRIGLAQALINDPDLLILDEPTTGLDPIGARQIKDLILLLRSRGKTVLLCSHLLTDVEDVCDRVMVLYGGKVHALGTVEELLTESNRTVFETDKLDEPTINRVKALLKETQKDVCRIESPRKRLDALFLEIVEKAQSTGAQTQGARSQASIAEFLSEGANREKPSKGDAVIQDLMTSSSSKQTVSKETDSSPAAPAKKEDENSIITDLTPKTPKPEGISPQGNDSAASSPEPAKAGESNTESESPGPDIDRDVIDGLLGNKKK